MIFPRRRGLALFFQDSHISLREKQTAKCPAVKDAAVQHGSDERHDVGAEHFQKKLFHNASLLQKQQLQSVHTTIGKDQKPMKKQKLN